MTEPRLPTPLTHILVVSWALILVHVLKVEKIHWRVQIPASLRTISITEHVPNFGVCKSALSPKFPFHDFFAGTVQRKLFLRVLFLHQRRKPDFYLRDADSQKYGGCLTSCAFSANLTFFFFQVIYLALEKTAVILRCVVSLQKPAVWTCPSVKSRASPNCWFFADILGLAKLEKAESS